jgi:RHS repeat-associated protein
VTDVEQFDHLGNRLTKIRHFFKGQVNGDWGYVVPWWNGREIKTEFFAANGTTVLKRIENDWRQIIPSWCYNNPNVPSPCGPNPPETAPTINPFILETKTTLVDANLVSKTSALKPDQTFGFDSYNNQTDLYEYDFGTGVVGPLKRHTQYQYLSTPSYTSNDVHILNLPTRMSIYDGAGIEQARTTYEYDVYSGANHATLKDWSVVTGSGMFGHDSAFSSSNLLRGNRTATTQSLFTNGVVTGSISSFLQYDLAGNPVKSIDARGNATTIDYLDCFGAPNGEARTNGASGLSGTGLNSYAFPTVVMNTLNHKVYSQFDYYLGQPVDVEDPNGALTSFAFNDPLERPTQVKRAVGTALQNQTTFSYDDTNRIITASTDRDANNDNIFVSKTLYDGMGRNVEVRQYEGGSNYVARQTQYDALGRPFKLSNPFRPWQSESAVWTTHAFDSLGRIVSVTTPDNATVLSSYSGNTITVTDQAGNTRKSVSDALGRMRDVYEDPAGLNYQTTYVYNVFDNLVSVTQGTQQRFFMYDSLNRLIRARQPEQITLASLNLTDPLTGNTAWTSAYQYDANGNMTQRTDARGVVSTYVYDALNRHTTIDHSDTASINPDISHFYDGATNGKGKLWYSYAGGSETVGAVVEKSVVESYDILGRPLVLKQLFKVNSVWSAPYQVTRTYNLNGNVSSQIYPSGNSVTYRYDAAGRLADKDAQNLAFTGNLGDGVQRTYSRGLTYASGGQLKQEQFGTTTPVYNKLFYNSRQQLAEILASTAGGDTSWNRGKILNQFSLQCSGAGCNATNNNGNLRKQEVYIPANDQVSSYTSWSQQYDYDSLNRLLRVHEYTGTPALDSQQEFVYDRWGNRTIHQSNTFGAGINKKNFTVATANNRLGVPAGQSGTLSYDLAGNLTTDTYTGVGNRTYDAENKMTSAQDSLGMWSYYTYNAGGQRTRRKISNQETWQIYGFEGELVAEYPASGAVSSPQKEYGYRNGQLLVTANGNGGAITNFALNKIATQSSTHSSGAVASRAVDGNTNGVFANGSVTHTNSDVNAWWHVDLGQAQSINTIKIWNRVESPERLTNFYVFVSDVPFTSTNLTTTINQAGVSSYQTTGQCGFPTELTINRTGRYIRVQLAGTNYLSIAEVQVLGTAASSNVALSKTATQSSTHSSGAVASRAVDGNTDGVFANGSVTHTNSDVNAWWHVDLGQIETIGTIKVWNRVESPERLTNFYVFVSDVPFTSTNLTTTLNQAGVSSYLTPGQGGFPTQLSINRTGRYVRVQLAGTNYLSLAEVQVWTGSTTPSVQWLISDQLGTPRMVLDQTGSLAGVKRHDYLPFGEELVATQGLRTAALGYTGDGVRQQFTSQERDTETGLDYFKARYYSSVQGRFTSIDPGSFQPADPQNWNRYTYIQNNPLKFIDPTGRELYVAGEYADEFVSDLERLSGLELKRDPTTGKVTIDTSKKYKSKNTSRTLANAIVMAIKNSKAVNVRTVSESKDKVEVLVDRYDGKLYDIDDHRVIKRDAPELAAGLLTHVLVEYNEGANLPPGLSEYEQWKLAHPITLEPEAEAISDFNGWFQAPRSLKDKWIASDFNNPPAIVRNQYSTVHYDIILKSGALGRASQIDVVMKTEKPIMKEPAKKK